MPTNDNDEDDTIFHMDTFDPEQLLADLPPVIPSSANTGNDDEAHALPRSATTSDSSPARLLGDRFTMQGNSQSEPQQSEGEHQFPQENKEQEDQGSEGAAQNYVSDAQADDEGQPGSDAGVRVGYEIGDVVPDAYLETIGRRRVQTTPGQRGGRMPALYRAEVDEIRASNLSIDKLAAHWGVSPNTIRRAKGSGVFKNTPYIPADEYVRPQAGEYVQPKWRAKWQGENVSIGRPLKGHKDLTRAEIEDIAWSADRTVDMAAKYNISTGTVVNIRKNMQGTLPPGVTLEQAILADPRDHSTIGRRYGVLPSFVDAIKKRALTAAQRHYTETELPPEVTSEDGTDEND